MLGLVDVWIFIRFLNEKIMNLILIAFGDNIENHYQAVYSILTFMKSETVEKIIVVTDNPGMYGFIGERVTVSAVDSKTMDSWKGSRNFFWRIKIKAIEHAVNLVEGGHVLYVDSDTVLYSELAEIRNGLSAGNTYMHVCESTLHNAASRTMRKMWKTLGDNEYCGFKVGPRTEMWNAGVIGIPAHKASETLRKVLALCDRLCETDAPNRLLEQLAFSIVLSSDGCLMASNHCIGHYWGNKAEWNKYISQFLVYSKLKNHTILDDVDMVVSQGIPDIPLHIKKNKFSEMLRRIAVKVDSVCRPRNAGWR